MSNVFPQPGEEVTRLANEIEALRGDMQVALRKLAQMERRLRAVYPDLPKKPKATPEQVRQLSTKSEAELQEDFRRILKAVEESGPQGFNSVIGSMAPQDVIVRQLEIVIDRLRVTRSLKQVYLFGSFISGKASPNDINLLVVMNAGFSTTQLGGKVLELFQHDLCRIRYHADLFWVTKAVGRASIEELLEVFSRDREGRAQSVIEVKL